MKLEIFRDESQRVFIHENCFAFCWAVILLPHLLERFLDHSCFIDIQNLDQFAGSRLIFSGELTRESWISSPTGLEICDSNTFLTFVVNHELI